MTVISTTFGNSAVPSITTTADTFGRPLHAISSSDSDISRNDPEIDTEICDTETVILAGKISDADIIISTEETSINKNGASPSNPLNDDDANPNSSGNEADPDGNGDTESNYDSCDETLYWAAGVTARRTTGTLNHLTIYVRNHLSFTRRAIDTPHEAICVEIEGTAKADTHTPHILATPPTVDTDHFLYELLLHLIQIRITVIIEDFNYNVVWLNRMADVVGNSLIDFENGNILEQLVEELITGNSFLDLICSTVENLVTRENHWAPVIRI